MDLELMGSIILAHLSQTHASRSASNDSERSEGLIAVICFPRSILKI